MGGKVIRDWGSVTGWAVLLGKKGELSKSIRKQGEGIPLPPPAVDTFRGQKPRGRSIMSQEKGGKGSSMRVGEEEGGKRKDEGKVGCP